MRCSYCESTIILQVPIEVFFCFTPIFPASLCQICQSLFTKIVPSHGCQRCSIPSEVRLCSDCLKWQQAYPQLDFKHQGLYRYDENMKSWFQSYKFVGDEQLASCFEKPIRHWQKTADVDVTIPIPLSPNKLAERGFNQVESLLNVANIAFETLLIKENESLNQSQRNRLERLAINQPFQLMSGAKERLEGKKVLIVDDIYTTGRTIYWAALLIYHCKPLSIRGLSLAR